MLFTLVKYFFTFLVYCLFNKQNIDVPPMPSNSNLIQTLCVCSDNLHLNIYILYLHQQCFATKWIIMTERQFCNCKQSAPQVIQPEEIIQNLLACFYYIDPIVLMTIYWQYPCQVIYYASHKTKCGYTAAPNVLGGLAWRKYFYSKNQMLLCFFILILHKTSRGVGIGNL